MAPLPPEKGVACHRTFARPDGPIDCRTLVCDHGCRLWKRVTLTDRHPETGAEMEKDTYDCIDSQQELFWKDMLRRQLQTTRTVDNLRQEVRESNAGAMGALLGGVNKQLRALQDQTHEAIGHMHGDAPKLIGN